MEKVEKEHFLDVKVGELDHILQKLEKKGAKKTILKFKAMQELRANANSRVSKWLDQFKDSKDVLDSSHVVGGKVILRFVKRWKANRAMKTIESRDKQPSAEKAKENEEKKSRNIKSRNQTAPMRLNPAENSF